MAVNNRSVQPIRSQEDIVRVRQVTRERAVAQGFSLVDQTKIVTAASELARNTLDYGGGGDVTIEVLYEGARKGVRLVFVDQGPGIPADVRPRLFEPLSRTRGTKRSGILLSPCAIKCCSSRTANGIVRVWV